MGKIIPLALSILLLMMAAMPMASGNAHAQAQTAKTPIRHVVEIMMENHAFDNIFGVYPFINGLNGGNPGNLTVPVNLMSMKNSPAMDSMKAVPAGNYSTKNPIEGYMAYHGDWNHGKMNGFLNYSGPQSMTYYTRSQMAPLWNLAEQYAMADNYFASALSETTPNRLYNIAGYTPVMNDYGPPPLVPFNDTIFGELHNSGVSWGYYDMNSSMGSPTLNFIQGISQYQSSIQSWSSFYSNLTTNSIPSVSYLMPVGGGEHGYDMGAPNNVIKGEMWLMYTLKAIMSSPAWNSTAVFITFDEGGGFYDQVAPPVLGEHQLGQRIPMLVVSPYAKENYISSTEMNHASMLAFIDYNWNLMPLNRFVSESNIPLDVFDFSSPYSTLSNDVARPAIDLASESGFAIPSSAYFTFNPNSSVNGSAFPASPQIPFNELNYSRVGNDSFNLSHVTSSYYDGSAHAYYPFYGSTYTLLALAVVDVAVAVAAVYAYRRLHK